VQALNNYDIPTVMGVIVFSTIIIIVFNLIVDLLYAVIDPAHPAGIVSARPAHRPLWHSSTSKT
jgi:hypothetical protein